MEKKGIKIMPIEQVRQYFSQYGMEGRIMELDHTSATVQLAAQALQCAPARIAKTLSFLVHGEPILIVAAGDAKISNPDFKHTFTDKAHMIKADQVKDYIGHDVGGVCPFAINEGVKVYLDKSLQRFDYVYPACGSSNSAIKLTLPELEKYSRSLGWVNVCKGWQ